MQTIHTPAKRSLQEDEKENAACLNRTHPCTMKSLKRTYIHVEQQTVRPVCTENVPAKRLGMQCRYSTRHSCRSMEPIFDHKKDSSSSEWTKQYSDSVW